MSLKTLVTAGVLTGAVFVAGSVFAHGGGGGGGGDDTSMGGTGGSADASKDGGTGKHKHKKGMDAGTTAAPEGGSGM
jgi:hypothetical protein